MSTRVSSSSLAQAAKELSIEWQQTRASWRDIKSQEFEQKYLDALPPHLARTMAVIEEIDALLRKVRHDCE
ncbi:MAG: hypothetical protein V4710_01575 [Verrucomicrobiota bacterium]